MHKYKLIILDKEWDVVFMKEPSEKTKKRWCKQKYEGFQAYGETIYKRKEIYVYTKLISQNKKHTSILGTLSHEIGHAWEVELPSHSGHTYNDTSADAMEYCVENIDRFKALIKQYKKDVKKVK